MLESHNQRSNVNMIGWTRDSFCEGNDYYFMWSYHSMDENLSDFGEESNGIRSL